MKEIERIIEGVPLWTPTEHTFKPTILSQASKDRLAKAIEQYVIEQIKKCQDIYIKKGESDVIKARLEELEEVIKAEKMYPKLIRRIAELKKGLDERD